MFVLKRNGQQEAVKFDKVTQRLKKLCAGLSKAVDPVEIAQQVCIGLYSGIKTSELDVLAAEIAAGKTSKHPEYGLLAGRILVSNLHKNTPPTFSACVLNELQPRGLCSDSLYKFVKEHGKELDALIKTDLDFTYDYFAYKTLEKSFLLRGKPADGRKVLERPQYMLLRLACALHLPDMDRIQETYALLSDKWFTHASPTLFNAGLPAPQMSSCYLVTMKDDSIEGIFDTLKQCAAISKSAGGIGISVSHIRATGSYIHGTNGISNGLVPMLRVFNNAARYVDQGGGKRKGSFCIYIEPWHADIQAILQLKKNHGSEEHRARDLYYAIWMPDLFMRRVEKDENWSLFCPKEAPGLVDVWGKEFETLYQKYEAEIPRKARVVMKARTLYEEIIAIQIETGGPFILFKDTCNAKSNQKNLGTIRSSNLCTEIIQFSSPKEIAVCNLASISLRRFANQQQFDHEKLRKVTHVVTRNLNRIIDLNHYPVAEAITSNLKHRPIGIGVQGLADCFHLLRLAYDSPEAATLNREIFETIYFAALEASCQLAKEHGPYSSYQGSPVSLGQLQPDFWPDTAKYSGRWDWTKLRADIKQYGLRNSLLVAPMPTASTSQILGNNECFEPYTLNMYLRRTLAGEFICVCPHLIQELEALGLWSQAMKQEIIRHRGSVQAISTIPADIKARYKTAFEISGKTIMDMAVDRGAFIDQSQSLNCYMQDPTPEKVRSMHYYAWTRGLKGSYYLRTPAAVDAIQFTVPNNAKQTERESKCISCSG